MQPHPHGQYRLAHTLVDTLHETHGFHPGFRAMHALGRIYRGTFTASGDGAALTRAAHFQPGAVVPATARLSHVSADPAAPRTAMSGTTAAIATKFYLGDGTITDLVAISIPAFPIATPEEMIAINVALRDPEATAAFVATHPKVAAVLKLIATVPAPKSFAETLYYPIHAFWFENAAGERRAGRYLWEPEAGISGQSQEEWAALPHDALFTEFEERLAQGPVRFALHLSLAEPEDDILDPTTPWPETRQRVLLGHLALRRRTSTAEIGDPIMMHDPTRLTDGIDVSDDPVLNARRGAYEVSAVNRGAGWKNQAAGAAVPE